MILQNHTVDICMIIVTDTRTTSIDSVSCARSNGTIRSRKDRICAPFLSYTYSTVGCAGAATVLVHTVIVLPIHLFVVEHRYHQLRVDLSITWYRQVELQQIPPWL